jgi:ribosome maturation factor RimP
MAVLTEKIITRVKQAIEPILDEMNIELVDVEYLSEHGRWVLRIYVDQEGGVTVDDCAAVSREIGDLIDMSDVMPGEYVLEVSSPGLNRPLKKEADFVRTVGEKVKIRMKSPVRGQRNFRGNLIAFRDGMLYLKLGNGEIPLPLRDVEKANLVYEFGD